MTRALTAVAGGIAATLALALVGAAGMGFGWTVGTVAAHIQADPHGPIAWLTATLALTTTGLLALALIVHHTWKDYQ